MRYPMTILIVILVSAILAYLIFKETGSNLAFDGPTLMAEPSLAVIDDEAGAASPGKPRPILADPHSISTSTDRFDDELEVVLPNENDAGLPVIPPETGDSSMELFIPEEDDAGLDYIGPDANDPGLRYD